MKIGIIAEGKIPNDSRVVLTPDQCAMITGTNDIEIVVQRSKNRCFSDVAYSQKGIKLVKNVDDCDVLIGVKEVPIDQLIPDKTYFFFSHTIKAQPYNRKLLQAILKKNIRLIDYEVLTNDKGQRVIAFGRFAGMVGAHNALMTYGMRTGAFHLDRMHSFDLYKDAVSQYNDTTFPTLKIVVTGTGRVGNGSCEVLRDMGIHEVSPESFLSDTWTQAVFTQLDCSDYALRKDGQAFDLEDFYTNPDQYKTKFDGYTKVSDIFINGIYWDPKAPVFFTAADMGQSDFNMKVIGDITCDIAPESSVPSTLRPSTIADPIYGYDPHIQKECPPFTSSSIDVMAIDNLPNELPKDASKSFGEQFIEHVLPTLNVDFDHPMITRATIAVEGQLGKNFKYLEDFAAG